MKTGNKTTKKPKKKGVYIRFGFRTLDWLKGQVEPESENADSVPAVVRNIVEEKKQAAEKPTTSG